MTAHHRFNVLASKGRPPWYVITSLLAVFLAISLSKSPPTRIPRLDMRLYLNGTAAQQGRFIRDWDNALHTHGFVVVYGHQVCQSSWEALRADARSFFHLPKEAKVSYENTTPDFCGPGYTRLLGSSAALTHQLQQNHKDSRDSMARVVIATNASPSRDGRYSQVVGPQPLVPAAKQYFEDLDALRRTVHEVSSLALGLPKDTLWNIVHDGNETTTRLVMNHYPAKSELQMNDNISPVRLGAHTDFRAFTILKGDDKDQQYGSLEVFSTATRTWIPVYPRKDEFIINVGDYFNVWTNGHWTSNYHRVAQRENVGDERMSIALFSGPPRGTLIQPIAHQDPVLKYHPFTALEEKCTMLGGGRS